MTDLTTPAQESELHQLQRAPFIPRSIDNTALQAYMECPRKYYYSMVEHRRRVGPPPPPLAYGTAWHSILEAHYKTGGDANAVVRAAIGSWEQHDNPDDHRTLERAISAYEAYIGKWGTHEEETRSYGKTVGYPENPVVEIPTELWWPGALHPYAGKIDRIFEHQGLFYVEDHKTTSQLGSQYFRQFDPSNQMMGYAWLAQKLTGLPIAGVRINAHGILKTQNKFERQTVMYSQDRLEEWGRNYNQWIVKINRAMEMLEMNQVGEPDAVLLAAFPHNFNACAGKYSMCQYVDVCTMPLRVRHRVLEADFQLAPWDPMAVTEAGEGEV